jgi:hypothetical protein
MAWERSKFSPSVSSKLTFVSIVPKRMTSVDAGIGHGKALPDCAGAFGEQALC